MAADILFPLYLLAVPFIAAFGAGALKLLWCEPRLVCYVVVGCVALCVGFRPGDQRVARLWFGSSLTA
jgi:hypothetical protein